MRCVASSLCSGAIPPAVNDSALLLFLVFDPASVRPAARANPAIAYLREYRRAEWLITTARRVRTALPIAVAVGGARCRECEANLTRLGALIIKSVPVPPPTWAAGYHRESFHKLRALGMTRWSRVIVLDNDISLVQNIDHLSGAEAPAAVWHPQHNHTTGGTEILMNSGLMVLQPNASAAAALLRLAASSRRHVYDGGDQEVRHRCRHQPRCSVASTRCAHRMHARAGVAELLSCHVRATAQV